MPNASMYRIGLEARVANEEDMARVDAWLVDAIGVPSDNGGNWWNEDGTGSIDRVYLLEEYKTPLELQQLLLKAKAADIAMVELTQYLHHAASGYGLEDEAGPHLFEWDDEG